VMAVFGEACSRDRPHVPEPENCKFHVVSELSELERAKDASGLPQQ
jgi:hypothetical protein